MLSILLCIVNYDSHVFTLTCGGSTNRVEANCSYSRTTVRVVSAYAINLKH